MYPYFRVTLLPLGQFWDAILRCQWSNPEAYMGTRKSIDRYQTTHHNGAEHWAYFPWYFAHVSIFHFLFLLMFKGNIKPQLAQDVYTSAQLRPPNFPFGAGRAAGFVVNKLENVLMHDTKCILIVIHKVTICLCFVLIWCRPLLLNYRTRNTTQTKQSITKSCVHFMV